MQKLLLLLWSLSVLNFQAPSFAGSWEIGRRSDELSKTQASEYVAAIRILDRNESNETKHALKHLLEALWSNAYAGGEPACLLAGWEGKASASGHCSPQGGDFAKAKAACPRDTDSETNVPCSPDIFGKELACVPLAKGDNRWTQACAKALVKQAGGDPSDLFAMEPSAAFSSYLASHQGLYRRAVEAAQNICGKVGQRASDQADCLVLANLYGQNILKKVQPASSECTDEANGQQNAALGKTAQACIEGAKAAIAQSEVNQPYAKCDAMCEGQKTNHCPAAVSCRSGLLSEEIKLALKKMSEELVQKNQKTGFDARVSLRGGACELTLGSKMLMPYDPKVSRIKDSKLKPVKTLVFRVQNEENYHAFLDRDHDLSQHLKKISDGTDTDSGFRGTMLEAAYTSCFQVDDYYRKSHGYSVLSK